MDTFAHADIEERRLAFEQAAAARQLSPQIMDEFCLFSRALNPDEIRALYSTGKPQPDPHIQTRN
jgi:hypothetical protein